MRAALVGIFVLCSATTLDALAVDRPKKERQLGRARHKTKRSLRKSPDGKEHAKMMSGVPVYGYHSGRSYARKIGNFASENTTALEDAVAEWIVMYEGISDANLKMLCASVFTSCTASGDLSNPQHLGIPFLLTSSTGAQLQTAMKRSKALGFQAEFAEHDAPTRADDAHLDFSHALDDTKRAATWGLNRVGRDSAPSTGANVHAYVLDTGVRTTHADFTGRAIPTLDTTEYSTNICACTDTSCAADTHGHGTHCASTVGGAEYGVAPDARIHGVKVFKDDGTGSLSFITIANSFVITYGQFPAVVSYSGTGPGTYYSITYSVNMLAYAGIPMVVAAGNYYMDACQFYPAYVPNAIAVGATTSSDVFGGYSNWGSCVDILAPGSWVEAAGVNSDEETVLKTGTSMACPHVTGAIAILQSMNPDMSVANLTAELLAKAESGAISSVPADTPNLLLKVDTLTR